VTVATLVGIFVGGQARRMGGMAKGLLSTPSGESVVTRLTRIARAIDADVVLIGQSEAYVELGLEALSDDPTGVGPLGGLSALLAEAERRRMPSAIALACDLPYVTQALLVRLVEHAPDAAAVAPRQDGKWQPLFARYAPVPALEAARAALRSGERALFAVLERLGARAVELPLDAGQIELLRDWDEPTDVQS
jgi:molybdopterin-guanine dinucleotide biosynthesis protein A